MKQKTCQKCNYSGDLLRVIVNDPTDLKLGLEYKLCKKCYLEWWNLRDTVVYEALRNYIGPAQEGPSPR